ncbi:MAG: pyridoxamine 5'-phosphate oxidase family protein [Planctomycetota bacterium]|nr:pyridoxamine 5'-phosphate oxidase family protein [Planctomycetota bacterium]
MAQRFSSLNEQHIEFIQQQHMFFVSTAPDEGSINLSPKGLGGLHIKDSNTIHWLNLTGSGNETATHVRENGRMTLLFCAFEGTPRIMRVYGKARVVHPRNEAWTAMIEQFGNPKGARQIFVLDIELVQKSCGYAIPLYEYQGQRDILPRWAENKTPEQIEAYWHEKNETSLNGQPTGLFSDG